MSDRGASDRLLAELAPRVLGTLVRRFGDFSAAEDAVQEALLQAALTWPSARVPDHPRAWLQKVASRRLIDQLRSDAARRRREAEYGENAPLTDAQDDTLALLFLCCHPSLTPSSAVALTLRAVGGLTTAQIASAFLVPEATLAQRISRAKQRIAEAEATFSLPQGDERTSRLASVLQVLYLMFNEGYTSTGPQLQRLDLAHEAIRLTRALSVGMDGHRETAGLLALMLLTDARRRARTSPSGDLIPLDEQDRSLWDKDEIHEGIELLGRTLGPGAGPYQIQAAIAALHDEAATAGETDWRQISVLYTLWMKISDNPMIALNHAVAAAMVDGPEVGLHLLEPLDNGRLAGHFRLDAVRAHLYERAGNQGVARELYRKAAARTTSIPERDYLNAKAARLERGP